MASFSRLFLFTTYFHRIFISFLIVALVVDYRNKLCVVAENNPQGDGIPITEDGEIEANISVPLEAGQEAYGIGIYMLNIADMKTDQGTYTADFFLYISRGERFKKRLFNGPLNADMLFVNAGKNPSVDGPLEKFSRDDHTMDVYRIKSTFFFSPSIVRYPFEIETLQIIIEDPSRRLNEIRFYPLEEKTKLSNRATFVGFSPKRTVIDSKIMEMNYPDSGEPYSRFIFSLTLERPPIKSWMKVFLAPTIIYLIVFFMFETPYTAHTHRLGAAGYALVGLSTFHVSVSQQTQLTGRFTFAEQFVIIGYVLVAYLYIITITVYAIDNRQNPLLAKFYYRVFGNSALMVSPITLAPIAWACGFSKSIVMPFLMALPMITLINYYIELRKGYYTPLPTSKPDEE